MSIELLHNALLVHDDIEDGSDERRGTPTLHALHGVPLALNAGDALGLLSLSPLKDNVRRLGLRDSRSRILEETERMAWETAEGQALELGWRRDNRIDLDRRRLSADGAAEDVLADDDPPDARRLPDRRREARGRWTRSIRLGFFFGVAFQIQDDLLNLEAGAAYGKERDGDLLEGKRTLMIIHALPSRQRRRSAGGSSDFSVAPAPAAQKPPTSRGCAALLDRTGAMEHARAVARSLAGAALFEFDRYFNGIADSRDLRFLRAARDLGAAAGSLTAPAERTSCMRSCSTAQPAIRAD